MKIYIFNPDTDMALAVRNGYYTPTANVRRMMADMSLLPVWYADEGSAVLQATEADAAYLQRLKSCLDIPVSLVREEELRTVDSPDIRPWGWNGTLKNRLLRLGVDARCLPTDAVLDSCRRQSSRSCAAGIYGTALDMDGCDTTLYVLHTVEECESCLARHRQGVVFKRPWSSSGKGLQWCRDGRFTPLDANWCRKAIAEQGSLVAAPIYNKVLDFAMEFRADAHEVRFVGHSLFRTDESGRYKGNALLTDERIEQELAQYVPLDVILRIRERLTQRLALLDYTGYLGADMLIFESGGTYGVCPTVELNLRMNMGILCHTVVQRYIAGTSTGLFGILHFASTDQLRRYCDEQQSAHPLAVVCGRIRSGFLALTAVDDGCQNVAYVMVEPSE